MAEVGAQAIEELFSERYGDMLARARAVLSSDEDARDAVQDAVLSVLGGPSVLASIENVGSWLMTLVYRRCVDIIRRESRRRTREEGLADLVDGIGPVEEARGDELAAAVARAVEALPPEQRSAFVENALEGRTFREISDATGIPMGTLMARKKKAVDAIRVRLEKEELL
jgi:RNA polymerase sigma factor (sigma-70 family)